MKMLPITSHRTKMAVSLKVECAVRAWGVSSWIEGFLCDSARRTYSNWLDYAGQRVEESMQSEVTLSTKAMSDELMAEHIGLSATNLDRFSSTIESTVDDDRTESQEIAPLIDGGASEQTVSAQIESTRSSTSGQMSYGQMPLPPVHGQMGQMSHGQNGQHHMVHIIEMGRDGMSRRSSDECPEVHESRGIFKKKKVSLRLRMCRCVMRICPSWFLSEKKGNVDLLVDTRWQCLEGTLWCVIVLCLTMICVLFVHRYFTP